ncbi:hypothetical protein ACVBIO_21335 [Shewanella sp. 0m-8]
MQNIDCNEPRVVRIGLKTVLDILAKWNCSQQQIQALLKLPENFDALSFEEMSFSDEQVERVSYILNIHAGLRVAFTNQKNIYGFMSMVNHASPFNGMQPIDFICNGDRQCLQRLQAYIDGLINA